MTTLADYLNDLASDIVKITKGVKLEDLYEDEQEEIKALVADSINNIKKRLIGDV